MPASAKNNSAQGILSRRLQLARLPSPLQLYTYRGASFSMKRDDLTGTETTGNKIRKLEYILYHAKRSGYNLIVTCGGEQSNHARATAAACAEIGLPCKLILWGRKCTNATGNLFLDMMFGAGITFVGKSEYFALEKTISGYLEKFKAEGFKPYFIPEGGSNEHGLLGYANAIAEDYKTYKNGTVNSIIAASGSGGTAAGLLLGSALFGLQLKVIAVNVLYSEEILREKILSKAEAAVRKFRLNVKVDESLLEILPGYSEEGYKHIADGKLRHIMEFASVSGLLFDPAYTGKAFYAYQSSILKPGKISKTLFLHTGGIFGVFDRSRQYLRAGREKD